MSGDNAAGDAGKLTRIVREVADEWAAQGHPLLVPPDVYPSVEEENRQDREFWAEVNRRMAERESGVG